MADGHRGSTTAAVSRVGQGRVAFAGSMSQHQELLGLIVGGQESERRREGKDGHPLSHPVRLAGWNVVCGTGCKWEETNRSW
jgi:hypothetical protein